MKAPVLRSALFALLPLVLSPPALVHASPSLADGLHFCAPLDYEQWRRDHPRPAAKRLADLDTGEPRTVRLFYFLPNDRPYQAGVVDSMKTAIRQVQTFFGEQMQAHGFGYKTFRFETDDQDEPLVHRVDGQHPDRHYVEGTFGAMYEEMKEVFDLSANINVLLIDNSTNKINRKYSGTGARWSKHSGHASLTDLFIWQIIAHELGHAFGLPHDFRDDAYIMSYGFDPSPSLSVCSAEFLAVHPYFNPDVSMTESEGPAIERLSSPAYPAGSESVAIQLRVSDADELHHVRLNVLTRDTHTLDAGFEELKSCRGLAGEEEEVVEFEYDGVIPSGKDYGFTDLSDPPIHPIFIEAVDTDGNIGWTFFNIWEISPQHIATIEGHTSGVRSVVFSPDGTTLASGAGDGIKLWDGSTRTTTATLSGGSRFGVLLTRWQDPRLRVRARHRTVGRGDGPEYRHSLRAYAPDPLPGLFARRRDARLGGPGGHPTVEPGNADKYRDPSRRRRLGGLLPRRGDSRLQLRRWSPALGPGDADRCRDLPA